MATLATGFGSLLIAMELCANHTRRQKIGMSLLLSYFLAIFAFIQYPPFQIMTAFPIILFFVGFLLKEGIIKKEKLHTVFRLLGWLGVAGVLALILLGSYYLQHRQAIEAVLHTAFPASRIFPSGQGTFSTFMHLLFSPFSAELQHNTAAAHQYWSNQSEAALFIQYSPFLVLPAGAAIRRVYVETRRVRWDLLLLLAGTLLIYVYIFVPGLTDFFKVLGFTSIPLDRLELGTGLLDFFLLLLLAKEYAGKPLGKRVSALFAAIVFVGFCLAGEYTRRHYPGLITRPIFVIGASFWMAFALWFLMRSQKILAFSMLVLLSFVSVFHINPLYQGLSPLTDTLLSSAVRTIVQQNPNGRWITTDQLLETYPIANGAKSITGNYSYPQKQIWREIGGTQTANSFVYNRSAHVTAAIGTENGLALASTNHFILTVNPCSTLPTKLHVQYVMTIQPEYNACLETQKIVSFPNMTVYIYMIVPPNTPTMALHS
jgi:hypothetical protein